MTPKEKATELLSTYSKLTLTPNHAKECALILVEELLSYLTSNRYWDRYDAELPSRITFWNEVKVELEKIN